MKNHPFMDNSFTNSSKDHQGPSNGWMCGFNYPYFHIFPIFLSLIANSTHTKSSTFEWAWVWILQTTLWSPKPKLSQGFWQKYNNFRNYFLKYESLSNLSHEKIMSVKFLNFSFKKITLIFKLKLFIQKITFYWCLRKWWT